MWQRILIYLPQFFNKEALFEIGRNESFNASTNFPDFRLRRNESSFFFFSKSEGKSFHDKNEEVFTLFTQFFCHTLRRLKYPEYSD
jgi:hypothetical protein